MTWRWGAVFRTKRSGVKKAVVVSAILVAAGAASQLLLPRMLETQIAAGIKRSLAGAGAVRVDIASFPALEILAGRVDKITVDIRQAVIDGLKVEAFVADARNLQLDMPMLRLKREFVVKEADVLQVTVAVAEADLNEYFAKSSGTAKLQIALTATETTLTGDVSVLGRPVQVTVKGHFAVTGATRVAFVVDDLLVMQTRLPRFIVEPLTGKWAVEFDLAGAPVPLEITELHIENKRLYIYGQRPSRLPDKAGQTDAGSAESGSEEGEADLTE